MNDPLVGTSVGNYRLTARIGEGGMARVYRAVHPDIGREVAVKVLSIELASAGEVVRRFKVEAQTVNKIRHPNIVQIFDFGALPDGRPFYIMELLEGESLAQRIKRAGAMQAGEMVSIMDPVLDALDAAHRASVVHRDLKPDNVYLHRASGRLDVKLLDFGIAKLLDAREMQQTRSGILMGTPAYMAPEQAAGRVTEIGPRTDIYAVGVMMYEMLSATLPFQSDNLGALLLEHLNSVPPTLEQRRVPGMPPELSALVASCLAKNPGERPASAAVLRERLRPFGSGRPIAETLLAPSGGGTAESRSVPPTVAASTTSLSAAASELVATPAPASGGRRGILIGVIASIALAGGVGWTVFGRASRVEPSPPLRVVVVPDAAPLVKSVAIDAAPSVISHSKMDAGAHDDAVSRLAALRRLFESGAISKKEYERRKKQILDEM